MQHEITRPCRLLNEDGNIAEPGFAKKLLWQYAREDIKAPRWRIKEWDYYYIGTQDYGLCLTISDSGYVSNLAVTLLGFGKEPFQLNDSEIGAFPLGKMGLPATSVRGDIAAKLGRMDMRFENDGARRHLTGSVQNFCKTGKALSFDVTLTEIPEESMVIATPFDKDKHFYYNQKINCMRAEGRCLFGDEEYLFDRGNGALATLDWGRGVWTYSNTWYWGSGQTVLDDGSVFGFNIGYGFGNTSAASENMLFYNGRSHKLEDVTFHIPQNAKGEYEYLKPWRFTSSDGRFEMDFTPVLDRQAPVNLGVICMLPHQVFGRMSGRAILDDGTVIELKNRMVFAERVHNQW